MPSQEQLREFVNWVQQHITGDEKGQAQIYLDRLFQAFGQPGCLDVGGLTEFRIRKDKEDGGGTAFADYVWKPVVLIEMKKRGTDLQKHYRQAFDYWTRLVPNRPRLAPGSKACAISTAVFCPTDCQDHLRQIAFPRRRNKVEKTYGIKIRTS